MALHSYFYRLCGHCDEEMDLTCETMGVPFKICAVSFIHKAQNHESPSITIRI